LIAYLYRSQMVFQHQFVLSIQIDNFLID